MAKKRPNRSNKPGPQSGSHAQVAVPEKPVVQPIMEGELTAQEFEEYQFLKELADENTKLDLQKYKERKTQEIDRQAEVELQKKIVELDKEMNARRVDKDKQLRDELQKIKENIKDAEKERKDLQHEIKTLEDRKEQVEAEYEADGTKAAEKAKALIDNAEKEAAAIYDEKIRTKETAVEEKETQLQSREMEINAKESTLKRKEARLAKKEEIYNEADPDRVKSLENQLEQKNSFIEQLKAEYSALQSVMDRDELLRLKVNGRSLEDLITEKEQLQEHITQLEDKCYRYTEFQLSEMKRALEEEPRLHREIEALAADLRSKKTELERFKNGLVEFEQLKAQMQLVRTLNDHLRQELETSKRALESRVGEVCPALTQIDVEELDENISRLNYEDRINLINANAIPKNLTDIVTHVKSYAASQPDPIYYNERDISAFLAGLAASKMTILQGLSGTGKTTLPKVFMDALYGEKRIVPVESSWRDRNELLGYYNDFNRKFTAKEFTCHLYRAGMPNYIDTPFFIILDEMNLSRVEYYFADFLSILEDNRSNWKIRLVDVDLRSLPSELPDEVIEYIEQDGNQRINDLVDRLYNLDYEIHEDNTEQKDKMEMISYLSKYEKGSNGLHRRLLGGPRYLINGNTIRIPENVWFICTANRDESTFEISDKVYDRSQILNFNSRAEGNRENYDRSMYVSCKMLNEYFTDAIKQYPFMSKRDTLIRELDTYLRKKFRVSFGNRIAMQMDRFVPVYVAACKTGSTSVDELQREAIDYQITNKVLRKLEHMQVPKESLEELKIKLENEFLFKAADFIDWKLTNEV